MINNDHLQSRNGPYLRKETRSLLRKETKSPVLDQQEKRLPKIVNNASNTLERSMIQFRPLKPIKKISKISGDRNINNIPVIKKLSPKEKENIVAEVKEVKKIEVPKALDEKALKTSLRCFPFSVERLSAIVSLRKGFISIEEIDQSYFQDSMFCRELLRTHPETIFKVPTLLIKDDPSIMQIAGSNFDVISQERIAKREDELQKVYITLDGPFHNAGKLLESRDFVEGHLRTNGLLLKDASSMWKSDKEMVKIAIEQNYLAFIFADSNLQKDQEMLKDFARERIRQLSLAVQ